MSRDALATPTAGEERDRKIFEAGYESFCQKHYTLDEAWAAFASADEKKGDA